MARGIPNSPRSGKARGPRDAPALASAAINTDFATMTRPEWRISDGLVPYDEALATMEARVADIRAGRAGELIWLLEHPPLYTAGTNSKPQDLLQARFPVHVAGRGGQYTYHGPGQRLVYPMLDLLRRRQYVRRFVSDLEDWTIRTLARFNVRAERRDGRVGVWVAREGQRE